MWENLKMPEKFEKSKRKKSTKLSENLYMKTCKFFLIRKALKILQMIFENF